MWRTPGNEGPVPVYTPENGQRNNFVIEKIYHGVRLCATTGWLFDGGIKMIDSPGYD